MITTINELRNFLNMSESAETDLVPLIHKFVNGKNIDLARTNDDDIEELAKEFKAKHPNVKDSLQDINYSIRSQLGMGYPEPKKEPEGEPEYYSRDKNYKTSYGDKNPENHWLYRRLTMPVHPHWFKGFGGYLNVVQPLTKNYYSLNVIGILSVRDLQRMFNLKYDKDEIYLSNDDKSIIVYTTPVYSPAVMLYFKYSVDYVKFKNTCKRFLELLPNDNGQYLGIHLRYPYGLEPYWDDELKGKVKKVI